jgi:hypothetical protein
MAGRRGTECDSRRGEQSVNNLRPNTRKEQVLSGITGNVVINPIASRRSMGEGVGRLQRFPPATSAQDDHLAAFD